MPEEKQNAAELHEAEHCGYWCAAAYIGPLCLLTWLVRRSSPRARFHANQGLVLFLIEAVFFPVLRVLETVSRPVLPAYLAVRCIGAFITLFLFTLAVLGVMHAVRGEDLPLPLIGGIRVLR